MKCKQCGADAESKGTKPKLFCSDACRKKYNRTLLKKRTEQADTTGQRPEHPQTAPFTQNTDEQEPAQSTNRTATLQDYLDNPDDYCARQEPDRMNWGAWLDLDELRRAGLKCNRVAIPGDWDYAGRAGTAAQRAAQLTTAAPAHAEVTA